MNWEHVSATVLSQSAFLMGPCTGPGRPCVHCRMCRAFTAMLVHQLLVAAISVWHHDDHCMCRSRLAAHGFVPRNESVNNPCTTLTEVLGKNSCSIAV